MMHGPSTAIGSSPRGRGTRRPEGEIPLAQRFIPARAGNARSTSLSVTASTVHPRAGGERRNVTKKRGVVVGSSPRGRGTRCVLVGR